MEKIKRILEREGYGLFIQPRDENAFYNIIEAIKYTSDKRSWWKKGQTKKEIFDFELQNALYFHLFLAQCIECDGGIPPENCLEQDFKQSEAEKRSPSPREIFAASEILQRQICLYRLCASSIYDIKDFRGFIFTPVLRNVCTLEPLCVVMLERSDSFPEFALIDFKSQEKMTGSCPGVILNMEHKDCFGFKFSNDYEVLFSISAYGHNEHTTDLFKRFSLELYGSDEHHKRILNIICEFELIEDNVDLFYKYADESSREEIENSKKKKLLKNHIEKVRSRSKEPGNGEFFALSSVFNVDIFIRKGDRDCWELYTPVTSTYAKCHDSPILLIVKQTNSLLCKPYVTNRNKCACRQDKPVILGHIGMVTENIYKTVFRASCCPSSRHAFHKHLDHIPNSRTTWPEREDSFAPDEFTTIAAARLSTERRRIDQINGGMGTLAQAISKEIYESTEFCPIALFDVMHDENLHLDQKLQGVADWTNLPIYILNMKVMCNELCPTFHWTRFEPKSLNKARQRRSCRFYITLFHKHSYDVFDRIIPLEGCNCHLQPPAFLLQTASDCEIRRIMYIEPSRRHRSFHAYFSEVPNESMYCTEVRDFPPCSPYSVLQTVQQRADMKNRTIDFIEFPDHSLLRCLSKEIFGTEQHVDFLIKELTNEIQQNITFYLPFVDNSFRFIFEKKFGKMKDSKKEIQQLVIFAISRIEDDLLTGNLLLLAISTFFQSDVFVLRFEESELSAESYWTKYSPLRRKQAPNRATERTKMFLTFLETQTRRFYRVVSKDTAYDFGISAPNTPDKVQDPLSISFDHSWRIIKQMRKIEAMIEIVVDEIDQWLKCNLLLQQTCDQVIAEMELRRRNVNVATISGSTVGILGSVVTAVGIVGTPFTAGMSLGLSVAGGVITATGGTVAAGAKITETVLNTNTLKLLRRYQEGYQERLDSVQFNIHLLDEEIKKLGDIASEVKTNQSKEIFDFAALQSLPGILRMIKGLTVIPLAVLRNSARGITILGVVIGPLSALIDVGFLAFSIRNMFKSNKTDMTEKLRTVSASLYCSRRQMHAWAYGNQKIFLHNLK